MSEQCESNLLERIMQGLHIAIMADVGIMLTNADAKGLLDELTVLVASNVRLHRENEALEKYLQDAHAFLKPLMDGWEGEAEDEAWKNL